MVIPEHDTILIDTGQILPSWFDFLRQKTMLYQNKKLFMALLYVISCKQKDGPPIVPPLLAMTSTEDPNAVGDYFFEVMKEHAHYKHLPERPIQNLQVKTVAGIRSDTSHITDEVKFKISNRIRERIQQYTPEEATSS